MRTDRSRPWVDLLASLVPQEPAVGLLQALLWEGEAASAQWSRWVESVGDPKVYFEREYLGRKGLLGFAGQRISANEIEVGKDFATYVRVAQVREGLRSQIFVDALSAVQTAMDRSGLDPILINGAAYAFTVYPEPLLRHNHGIDLLLPEQQMDDAKRATAEAGFRAVRSGIVPHGVLETYRHGTGLELTLRSRLFLAPHVKAEPGNFRARCREISVEQVRIRVLGPADRLCHTLGESASAPTCRNLRWVCDAYLLLTREDSFDFDGFTATAEELGTALPSALLMDFLSAQLRIRIPAVVIENLRVRGIPRKARYTRLLLSTALRSSGSVNEFLKRARGHGPMFLKAARFACFPSVQHIVYQQRPTTAWKIPLLYVARIARLLFRPFRRLRTLHGGPRGAGARRAPDGGRALGGELES
jgi:hypothetical protein